MVDMILNFRTGFVETEDELIYVMDSKSIAKSYLSGWFFIDLVAILPYGYIGMGSSDASPDLLSGSMGVADGAQMDRGAGSLIKAVRLIKLAKLLRLGKLLPLLRVLDARFEASASGHSAIQPTPSPRFLPFRRNLPIGHRRK